MKQMDKRKRVTKLTSECCGVYFCCLLNMLSLIFLLMLFFPFFPSFFLPSSFLSSFLFIFSCFFFLLSFLFLPSSFLSSFLFFLFVLLYPLIKSTLSKMYTFMCCTPSVSLNGRGMCARQPDSRGVSYMATFIRCSNCLFV